MRFGSLHEVTSYIWLLLKFSFQCLESDNRLYRIMSALAMPVSRNGGPSSFLSTPRGICKGKCNTSTGFSPTSSCHWDSILYVCMCVCSIYIYIYIYTIVWGMNSKPVGGHSSETVSSHRRDKHGFLFVYTLRFVHLNSNEAILNPQYDEVTRCY
jgi:hypothetical protein